MFIENIESFARKNIITKENGTGHIDYKVISSINIKKFLEGRQSYFSSYELWNIAKEKFPSIVDEMEKVEKDSGVSIDKIDRIYYEIFVPRFYDASICEGIIIWNFERAFNFIPLPVTDDEDRKKKIDTRALYTPLNQLIQAQVKKKPKEFTDEWWKKTNRNLDKAEKFYKKRPELFLVEFDEDKSKRRFIHWRDENGVWWSLEFTGSFGRNDNFHKSFGLLLGQVISQKKYSRSHLRF